MIDSVPYFIARVSEDRDFFTLKEMVENHDGWRLDYHKPNVKVWTKQLDDSNFQMVKVWAIFSNVNCTDLYDTIQDPEYRKEWDTHMIVGIDIGHINPNNDVSYYAMYCPPPLKNRDFVLQKSWLDTGTEFYIINHSVCHKDYPPKKGFIRAISYFTGYFIRCTTVNTENNGCEFSYVTRTDPQGVLPSWLVNKCTQILAPRYVKQIEKAAEGYVNWKRSNNPDFKPWVYPEQILAPKVSIRDCVPSEEELTICTHLRKFNIELYLPPQTSVLPENIKASDGKSDPPKSVKSQTSSITPGTSKESCDKSGVHLGGAHQSTSKSNTPSQKERKKSKKRLNTILSFTKICRRGIRDE